MLESRRRPGLQGGRLARRGPRRLVGAPPRRAAERNRRRIPRVRRRAEAGPEGRRGARRPRRHRHGEGALRRLGLRGVFDRRQVPGPAHRLDGHLVPGPRGLQPLRQPRQRPQANSRPQQRGAAGDRGHLRGREAEDHGRVRPETRPRTKGARRLETPRDHAARGGLLCPERQRAQVAEVVHARRFQLPRGARAPHRRLRRRRKDQASGAPDVVLGDGRAIPGSQPRTLPAHGLRRRRVGPRVHDDLAGAGLRLPGRDLLPRRGPPRLHRRALHHQERHLHPRGGRRRPLEARGRDRRSGGAQEPASGPLLSRDRGELRVPRVLALLPGRQHRVRGAGHRHHGHLPLPRRRAAARTARSSTIAPTPRSTSTSSSPG